MPAINKFEWTYVEVVEVAKWQKYLIWLILFQVISILLFFMLPAGPKDNMAARATVDMVGLLILIARIVLGVFSIYCVYKMAVSLKKGTAILYAVAMFLPLISLLALASLSAEATRVLQSNDIRVGVMGADQADVERLYSGSIPPSI